MIAFWAGAVEGPGMGEGLANNPWTLWLTFHLRFSFLTESR
jgi:hypothetical protein